MPYKNYSSLGVHMQFNSKKRWQELWINTAFFNWLFSIRNEEGTI